MEVRILLPQPVDSIITIIFYASGEPPAGLFPAERCLRLFSP